MADEIFIPGYQTEITIEANDFTLVGNVVSYSDDQTAVPKPTFGSRYRRTIGGQSLYSIDVSGHLAANAVAELIAVRANVGPSDWTIQMGELGAPGDAGILAGEAIVTNLTFEADAEANWAWSLTLEGDGEPTYTPAVAP